MTNTQRSPASTKEQAWQIRQAWSNIGESVTYGNMTLAEFTAALTELEAEEATLKSLQDQLTSSRNQIKANRYRLCDLVKRARAGARARHGDDSDELERFGGIRMSERKRRRRSQADGG